MRIWLRRGICLNPGTLNTWPHSFGQEHNTEFKKWLGMTEKAERRYLVERATLLKERHGRWVAMGTDGVIAFGNTPQEAWDEAESRGFDKMDVIVRFLDPGPIHIHMHPSSIQII